MKKTFYIAAAATALLMVSTAAQAGSGFSFEIDGQKIHIDAPRNCNSLSCLSITNNGSAVNVKNLNGKKSNADDEVATNAPPPAPAAIPAPPAPAAVPAPPAPAAVSAPPAPAAVSAPPAPATTQVAKIVPPAPPAAGTTTTLTGTGFEPAKPQTSSAGDPSRERVTGLTSTLVANPAPAAAAPVVAAAPAIVPAPAADVQAAPPVQQQEAATTPLGLWATEDNKGNVRIEQCGANLCGYAEKTKEQILINMKPSQNKWVGRIHDPDSGSNYDSTIALKGPNVLKVQGCAFGGMFCGGQTWKRV